MSAFRQSARQFLDGLDDGSARRGPTVLRLIKSKTSQRMKDRNRATISLYESEALTDRRNKAFLDSIRHGAEAGQKIHPSIREIERYADDWAPLVPQSPAVRADILRRLGEEYRFEARHVRGILQGLGADDPAVRQAFLQHSGRDLDSIFADRTSAREHVRWMQSRCAAWFESLPVFWASFALTVTSTLGPVVLTLPIVLMAFGPWVATGVIFASGAISTLTLAYLAESQQRAGLVLREQGFNRAIEHYLGPAASRFLSLCLFAYCTFVLFIYCGGFLTAMDEMVGGPTLLYFAALCLLVVWYLSPKNTGESLVFAFSMAVLNAIIIIAIGIAFFAVAIFGSPASATSEVVASKEIPIQLAIGAVLYSFAGHISVSNGASMILARTQDGLSFTRGAAAGMGLMTLIYSFFAGSVVWAMSSGAISTNESVLETIRVEFGTIGVGAALVFVVLTLGIGSGNYAMAAHSVVKDTLANTRFRSREAGAQLAGPESSVPQAIGLLTISGVMGFSAVAYLQGELQMSALFGMVGGLMAPIVAGVFPVLLHLACRARGEYVPSSLGSLLPSRTVALLVFAAFGCVFLGQAAAQIYYPDWYRFVSFALLVWVLGLTLLLGMQGKFAPGHVIKIVKSADGWKPSNWQIFFDGKALNHAQIAWKTTRNNDFETVTSSTNPARVLDSVSVGSAYPIGANLDVIVFDETSEQILQTRSVTSAENSVEIRFSG